MGKLFNPIENDRKNPIQADKIAKFTLVFPCLYPLNTLLNRENYFHFAKKREVK